MTTFYPNEQDLRELIAEHEQLRREILHNQTTAMQTMTATMFLVVAVMGFAFTVENSAIKSIMFFVVQCAIVIGMLQAVETGWVTFLIASYLRVFTEAKLRHLKWETRLMEFRILHPELTKGGFIRNHLWVYTFINIVNFILGCWYALQELQNLSPAIMAYAIIILLVLWLIANMLLLKIVWDRNSKFIEQYGKTFESKWKKISKNEQNQRTKESGGAEASPLPKIPEKIITNSTDSSSPLPPAEAAEHQPDVGVRAF